MTKTGGRSATVRHIAGESALSVGMPNAAAPSGWRWVPLTSVARLESGHTPSRRHPEYWGGDIPWLSIRDAKANHGSVVDETIETTNETGIENSSARVLPKGTVCLSRTASVGYVTIMGRSMATSQDFVNWVCSDKLDPRFLQYLLIFEKPSLARFSSGAVHQTIYFPEAKAFHVCIPALEEQRRIVAVLDEACAAIATATANAEKNLANARELFSGELRQLFSGPGAAWEWKALGNVADARLGKMLDKSKNKGTPYPYLRNLNVRWFEFDLSDLLEMRFEETEQDRYTAIQGDLLIVEGGYPGRCAIWEGSKPIYFQKAIHRVRFSDPRLSKILMYMLFAQNNDGSLKRYFSGAGIQHLTGQSLAKIRVPLPPTHERDAIVARIEGFFAISEEARGIYQSKLVQLESLKQSLLYRAFSGELTSKAAAVVALNDNFATPEFAAKIVAFAYERHVARNRVRNFGTVKAEKILHMVEAIGGIDLGRQPLREAAGPDDAKHRHATWDWARSQQYFRFNKRSGGGHDFEKLSSYSRMIEGARTAIAGTAVEKAIELLVDMDRDFAELIATTYAAWNNLIIDQRAVTDDDIVLAARDNWHRDKLRFDPSRFHDAIRFIRNNSIIPDGTAKRVGRQEALLF